MRAQKRQYSPSPFCARGVMLPGRSRGGRAGDMTERGGGYGGVVDLGWALAILSARRSRVFCGNVDVLVQMSTILRVFSCYVSGTARSGH